MSSPAAAKQQYAALPYRRGDNGGIEVMLITSLKTKRWIIPKGWPVNGLAPHESAAREAMEEGGLVGKISERSIGSFSYEKRMTDGSTLHCTVNTFALEVELQLPKWPEQSQRRTQWFSLHGAANAVREPELRAMIANLAALLA